MVRLQHPALKLLVATFAILALIAPSLTAQGTLPASVPLDVAPCSLAEHFATLPGTGPSCLDGGLWYFRLDDGRILKTHGPDHLPSDAEYAAMLHGGHGHGGDGHGDDAAGPVGGGSAWRAPARAATCVDDPAVDKHGLILYTHPYDKQEKYAERLDTIRHMFYLANGLMRAEAENHGVSITYDMACDGDGVPRVDFVTLPTSRWHDDFWSIVNDLVNQGYDKSNAKYWIWHEDGISCGGCSGWGTIPGGDSASPSNANNAGPAWGVTFTREWMTTFMHENGHNMGAVQNSAPHTTGGWHCNDGLDIMCYADNGYKESYSSGVCRDRVWWDCDNDDYFHPSPAPGSYLDTHWNVAAPYNDFLERVSTLSLPSAPRELEAQHLPGGTVELTWQAPSHEGASPVTAYSIYRGPCVARVGAPLFGNIGQIETFLTRTTGTSFTDTLPDIGHWSYYVAAVNDHGEGAYSDQALALEPGNLERSHIMQCYYASGP
ncbi:MAG: hypothetical protein KY455_14175 [Euryarchaeota archaeon]|nr:hypothetical protein [Euryarchaeota archaeon]